MLKSAHLLIPHITAAGIALIYAWFISNSPFVQTGLQFIAPAILILLTHLIWLSFSGQLTHGFANVAFARTTCTTLVLALGIVAFSMFAPQPASANAEDIAVGFGAILGVIGCLAVLAIVLAIPFLLLWVILKIFNSIFPDGDKTDDRVNDFGTVIFALTALGIASVEGVPNFYSFQSAGSSTASATIHAPQTDVWQTMQTATSPAIALPNFLSNFPKPTQVIIDEGTALGAIRKVEFQGREGMGHLTLQVAEQGKNSATFRVLSDTSPYASWVSYKTLTYATNNVEGQTKLDVTLTYDRDLAPAWFFTPLVKFSAYLAMNVLASDVKHRAENPNAS